MRFQILVRFSLAAAVALLLCGPAVLAGETPVAAGDSTVAPSVEQDRAGDDDNRARDDGTDLSKSDETEKPPRLEMPEDSGRRERLDRRLGSRPERPERIDRVGSDGPRPEFRPERSERPGVSGLRPNG